MPGLYRVQVQSGPKQYENKDITKLTDDGKLTLDWESFFTEQGIEVVHPGNEGAVCGIDGKGC